MRIKRILVAIFAALLLSFSFNSFAEMRSRSYRIPSSVLSSGGALVASVNYQVNGTFGQPTPLMEPSEPPFSDNYDLYPGFWYTLAYYEVPGWSKSLPLILLLLNE